MFSDVPAYVLASGRRALFFSQKCLNTARTTPYVSPLIGAPRPSQLPGGLLDRMQGLAKLRESAKSAVKLELGNLARSGKSGSKSGSKSAPSNGGSITSGACSLARLFYREGGV